MLVLVTNPYSERVGTTGRCDQWTGDSFWVWVRFGRYLCMVARRNLIPLQ